MKIYVYPNKIYSTKDQPVAIKPETKGEKEGLSKVDVNHVVGYYSPNIKDNKTKNWVAKLNIEA